MTTGRVSAVDFVALLKASVARGREITIAPRGRSMMPFIRDGDGLVCRRLADGEPRLGDIVAFRTYGERRVLVHRVVRVSSEGIETRGDAMAGPDGWIAREDVIAIVRGANGKRLGAALGRLGRRSLAVLSRNGLLRPAALVCRLVRWDHRLARRSCAASG